MSGDHNMNQKPRSYIDDFECPRCGHCCQSKVEWVGLHGSEVPDTYKYDVMFMEGWLWAEERLKEKNHG